MTTEQEQRNDARARAKAFNITIIIIAAVVAVAACICAIYFFGKNQSMSKQIQSELAGDVLTYRETKNTGGIFGTKYYAFYRLKFNDDGTLDYYYATSSSIRESALPKYKNTYNYTVTISVFGVCRVKFSNYVFTLKLNDNGQVEEISGVSY